MVLGKHTRSDKVGHHMPTSHLDNKYRKMTSGRVCHHSLGQQARLDDVGRSMIAWSLRNTQGRSTPIFVCQHFHLTTTTIGLSQASHAIIDLGQDTQSNGVVHGMPSSTFDKTHGHTTSGGTCHHCPSTAHTVRQRRAWHAHIGLR